MKYSIGKDEDKKEKRRRKEWIWVERLLYQVKTRQKGGVSFQCGSSGNSAREQCFFALGTLAAHLKNEKQPIQLLSFFRGPDGNRTHI